MHRIGRAGRAGAVGESFTLITPADAPVARDLALMMRRSGEPVPRELVRVAGDDRRGYVGGGGSNRRWRSPPRGDRRDDRGRDDRGRDERRSY